MDTTQASYVGGFLPQIGAARERPGFDVKQPDFSSRLSPEVFPQGDTSARQRGVDIGVFPILGEQPKIIQLQDNPASPDRLSVIPLATRCQLVVFAYDQIIGDYDNGYFSREHIALSYEKLCEHRIMINQQIKSTAHDGRSYLN